jgi:hypothetical protein
MATITQILTALDVGGRTGVCCLPVDPALYPTPALRATAEAFAPFCTAEIREGTAGPELLWAVRNGQDARQVLGEFLNFALHAALRGRQATG